MLLRLLADCADAGGRGNERLVARRPADCCCSLRQYAWPLDLRKICCRRSCRAFSPAPAAIYLFTRAVVLLGAGRAALFPSLVPVFTLVIGA